MECKLLHCEYRAYKGVNYQTMPLQCIMFSGSTCSQLAIEMILISNEADLRADSNDSSPMCISYKITKLFKLFLHRSEREHTIVLVEIFLPYLLPRPSCGCGLTQLTVLLHQPSLHSSLFLDTTLLGLQ